MDVRPWWIGVDVGGTKTLTALVAADGTVGRTDRIATARGPAGVTATVVGSVRRLLAVAQVPVAGVGVGLPGVVDSREGVVAHAVNLGVEAPVRLAGDLSERLGGLPVHLENDLSAAALGAAQVMAEPDLAFLALGTGLAAGLLLDGRLRRGARWSAGEIGHLVHVAGGRACPCGQRGCLEQYASGSAIDAAWPSRTGRPAPAELFEAAAAGDPRAVAVRDEFVEAVAAAVRVLVLTCDVERVVLGGGVSELGAPLLSAVVARLGQEAAGSAFLASMDLPARVRLVPAGIPVGALGAALAAGGEH